MNAKESEPVRLPTESMQIDDLEKAYDSVQKPEKINFSENLKTSKGFKKPQPKSTVFDDEKPKVTVNDFKKMGLICANLDT